MKQRRITVTARVVGRSGARAKLVLLALPSLIGSALLIYIGIAAIATMVLRNIH